MKRTVGTIGLICFLWIGTGWSQQPPTNDTSDNGGNTGGGTGALSNSSGVNNTAYGFNALFSNIAGSFNTAMGDSALSSNTVGNNNTAIGPGALAVNAHGSNNTAVGIASLILVSNSNENIAVGSNAGLRLTSGDDNIYLGNNADSGSLTGLTVESNTMRLGQAQDPAQPALPFQTRTFIAGIAGVPVSGSPVLINSQGQLGIQASSARYKRDIETMGASSQGLLKLRPVTFRYKEDVQGERQYGLIAEEVEKVYPELVSRNAKGEVESVRYHELTPMLLNELLQQHSQLEAQAQQMNAVKSENEQLRERLERLEVLVAHQK